MERNNPDMTNYIYIYTKVFININCETKCYHNIIIIITAAVRYNSGMERKLAFSVYRTEKCECIYIGTLNTHTKKKKK